jgi:molybdopterin converting factor small subunit
MPPKDENFSNLIGSDVLVEELIQKCVGPNARTPISELLLMVQNQSQHKDDTKKKEWSLGYISKVMVKLNIDSKDFWTIFSSSFPKPRVGNLLNAFAETSTKDAVNKYLGFCLSKFLLKENPSQKKKNDPGSEDLPWAALIKIERIYSVSLISVAVSVFSDADKSLQKNHAWVSAWADFTSQAIKNTKVSDPEDVNDSNCKKLMSFLSISPKECVNSTIPLFFISRTYFKDHSNSELLQISSSELGKELTKSFKFLFSNGGNQENTANSTHPPPPVHKDILQALPDTVAHSVRLFVEYLNSLIAENKSLKNEKSILLADNDRLRSELGFTQSAISRVQSQLSEAQSYIGELQEKASFKVDKIVADDLMKTIEALKADLESSSLKEKAAVTQRDAAINEQKGLQSVINHLKEKAPLERESAIKSELKKISDFINLEFGAVSKFMNSPETTSFPPNVKSSWNIFEKEMKRIFENI